MKSKNILGIGLIILGIFAGLFVGIWLCLIGGIIQVVHAIQNPGGIKAMSLAIGLARFFCAGLAGWLSGALFVIPGWALANKRI